MHPDCTMAKQTIYSLKRQRAFELIKELLRDPSLSFTEIWRRVNAQLCGYGERSIITIQDLTNYCVYELGEECTGQGRLRKSALRIRFQKLFFEGRERYWREVRRKKLLQESQKKPVETRKKSKEERLAERERRREEKRKRKEALEFQRRLQKQRAREEKRKRLLIGKRWENFAPEVAYWLSTIKYGWCASCFYCFPLKYMIKPEMRICRSCYFDMPLQ